MPRTSIKAHSSNRKLLAAAKAVSRARNQIISSRRSNYSSGYGYGVRSGELKVIDSGTTAITVANTGGFTLMNGLSLGTDISNRVGRKIQIKSILSRLTTFPLTTASTATGDIARVIIFQDMQSNGAAPSNTDLLQAASYASPLNLANRDRFKILMDKTFTTSATVYTTGTLTAGDPRPTFKKWYKKCNMETIFNANNNGNITDIASGSLYMFAISSGGAIRLEYNHRVRFLDP